MIPLPEDIREEDIEQWLGRGVFLADTGAQGGPEPCTLIGVECDGRLAVCRPSGRAAIVPRDLVWAHWPACGALNINDDYAVFLQRSQSRQWRRTYSPRLLTLSIPNKYECSRRYGPGVTSATPSSKEVVRAAFNPHYVTAGVAIAGLKKGSRVSAAVNQHIILAAHPNIDGCNVLYRNKVAGRIDYNCRKGDRHVLLGADGRAPLTARLIKYLGGEVITSANT